jgi:hypothetical protein
MLRQVVVAGRLACVPAIGAEMVHLLKGIEPSQCITGQIQTGPEWPGSKHGHSEPMPTDGLYQYLRISATTTPNPNDDLIRT